MITATRNEHNPIVSPTPGNDWEAKGAFNGSVVYKDGVYHMVYRAQSAEADFNGKRFERSTVGYATSKDGVQFTGKRQLIVPEFDWEQYGCEDPRITLIDDTFYIFYTALSEYPFNANGIKVAVAVTKDFQTFEKHEVTPFNAKAFVLFPEKVDGKYTAFLTAHTDMPPSYICMVQAEHIEDLWSYDFWDGWYGNMFSYTIPLHRNAYDHVEVGAVPVKTDVGWMFFFSYIRNYFTEQKIFEVAAVLLDLHDPKKVIGRIANSILSPEAQYELEGFIPNIVFPTGALRDGDEIKLYYGAADTVVALAHIATRNIIDELVESTGREQKIVQKPEIKLERYAGNPIVVANPHYPWRGKCAYNPTALYIGGKVHIIYRAQSEDDTSSMGLVASSDGFHIDEIGQEPCYIPREEFEIRKPEQANSGCEDGRLVQFEDGTIYLTYTAYDGVNNTRVAMSTISEEDFLARRWHYWSKPVLISPPEVNDKNSCIFPEKIQGKYVFLHRIDPYIWLDYVDSIEDLGKDKYDVIRGGVIVDPRPSMWDSLKIGIAGAPIKTNKGWLLIYHGVSKQDMRYRLGAVLLDLKRPEYVLSRLDDPILEPDAVYENSGLRPGTVFSCGAIVKDKTLFVYYGGADQNTCVATIELERLLTALE